MVRMFVRSIDELIARLNDWQQKHSRLAFLYAVIKKYIDDEAGHRAALLTYYAFLAIFPLLMVLTTLFQIWLNRNGQLKQEVMQRAVSYFPAIGQELQSNIHALHGTGWALIAGIAVALYGARGVADVLRSSLDHIWQVPYAKRSRLPGSLVRSFAIILIAGLGLAVTPVLFGYALAFAPNRIYGVLTTILTAFVLFWVLILVIKIGTSTAQPLRRIWVGATIALVSQGILQAIGSYIMARELHHLDALYGIFALVLGLVFWLYLQAQVLMLSFEVDAVRYFNLWPRSLNLTPTPADMAAYRLYHDRARFHEGRLATIEPAEQALH